MTLQPHSDPISDADYKKLELRVLELRDLVKGGVDPLAQRKANGAAPANTGETFREVAEGYIASQRGGWKNEKHADQWESTLTQFVYPHIGNMRPHEIGIEDVLRVLQQPHRKRNSKRAAPLWDSVPETASRVRMRIEKIISAAKSKGVGSGDRDIRALWTGHVNPAIWKDGLEHWLAKDKSAGDHFAALPYRDVPAIVQALLGKRDFSSRALALTILTAVRTNECLQAEWSEIDLDAAVWIIPAERMKAGRQHRVPLSSAAVELLRTQPRFQGDKYVFPGAKRGRPLSNMAMLEVLRGMKGHGWTVHGFRSSFRDWITDVTLHSSEIAEASLAHTIGNKTEAAYRRGEAFERRAILMQHWCDYLTMKGTEYEIKWKRYIAVNEIDIAA
ncbi:tyrosine-type recombinase/integrase [Aquamicrobium defluvii]|uniref:Integrase n=1 Tax=Aquamicrobium defluvii TaxID=69279 RepID=A0A4R6Y4Y9_9HYPH|nr:site-specific integrase [Aquamicrobium defluvii]TDR30311.1 integrase [Aquamicrobium defluvii]